MRFQNRKLPQNKLLGAMPLCECTLRVSPFVNRGSGSFRKNDLRRLLMTLRSRHFCGGSERCLRPVRQRRNWKGGTTHVFLDVNVSNAFGVELLLHVGDGGVVSGNSVDPRVLQASVLHHMTTHLHDQGNKLENTISQFR